MTKTITIECQDCRGRGYLPTTELFRGKRVECGVPCHTCRETGTVSFEFECCDRCGDPCCDGSCQPDPAPAAAPVVWNGGIVDAPGFTSDTFAASLARAFASPTMHMDRLPDGSVRVDTGRTGHVHIVTRQRCTCPAGRTHGYCRHRSAVIYTHDICGIDFRRDGRVLGFNELGDPVTADARRRQLAAA